jgi:hypothetical protein
VTSNSDLLYTFTGISSRRVSAAWQAIVRRRSEWQTMLTDRVNSHPLESLAGFLFSASAAFYLAERDVNPKIQTFVDSLYYISTCMSVGYADVFAQTQRGKLIAMLAMTVGPALTASALDPPGKAEPASAHGQELLLQRLDAILAELRQREEGSP